MKDALVEFEQVHKRYGDVAALSGLTFSAPRTGCVALLGPNGAGKTTAIKSLLGLVRIESGRIEDRSRLKGYLPQQPALFAWMTAAEFLRFVGTQVGLDESALKERVPYWLKRLLGDERIGKRRIQGFSGGMKQRLALASVLLLDPDLLVLDEPVSALDPVGRHDVLELIGELKRDRCVLMSTHILADAERVCDQVVIMARGKALLQSEMTALRSQLSPQYEVEVDGGEDAVARFEAQLGDEACVAACRREGTVFTVVLRSEDSSVPALLEFLARQDAVRVVRFGRTTRSLEDVFMQVVEEPS